MDPEQANDAAITAISEQLRIALESAQSGDHLRSAAILGRLGEALTQMGQKQLETHLTSQINLMGINLN